MGHISGGSLSRVIWYTRRIPSHLSVLLDLSKRNLIGFCILLSTSSSC